MKNSNLSISNLTSKRSEAVCKVQERLPIKAKKTANKNLPTLPTLPTTYRNYTPKIRQQAISNKLLNSQLYELYTVRKLHCVGAWLKANIVDGTITIAKQTYIVSWLDILPIDAYKEEAVVISLRSPKYKDSRSKEYSLAYAVVSKLSN